MIRVKATREGHPGGPGKPTATGWIINDSFPFIALPSTQAKLKWVKVRNPQNGRWVCAQVMDVGPWYEHDDNYVFQPATTSDDTHIPEDEKIRPSAENGLLDTYNRKPNGAGIDLGEYVWHALGMRDNDDVEWEFIY